jgi:hypothetical protein
MNRKIFFPVITLLALATAPRLTAEPVDWGQLPAVVQRTINEQRGPTGIATIEQLHGYAVPVYDVRLNGPGPENEFYVTQTGSLVNLRDLAGKSSALGGAQTVEFDALPLPVQNAVHARAGNAPLGPVQMISSNGQSIYDVPYRNGNQTLDLWIDSGGRILAVSPARSPLVNPVPTGFRDLPWSVESALRTYAQGDAIQQIEKGLADGRTVYDVTLNHLGRPMVLRLAQNGGLIGDSVDERFLADTGRLAAVAAPTYSIPPRAPLSEPVRLSFNQLPLPVLSTLQRYAGADFIDKLERGIVNGQTVYQADFRHGGQEIPLRIADTGALINDDINNWGLAKLGQAPAPIASADWRSAPARVQLSYAQTVSFSQLPIPVQDTLRYYAAGGPIGTLVQGTAAGQPVYQADIWFQGQDTVLRIAPNGVLLDDQPNDLFLSQFNQAGTPAVGLAPAWQTGRATGYVTPSLRTP